MKYLFLICLSLTIYSCKNAEEPVEKFDKNWLLGDWNYLAGNLPGHDQPLTGLTNEYIGDTLFLDDAYVFQYGTSGRFMVSRFKAEIISINVDSNYIEIKSDKYPSGHEIFATFSKQYISIKAKYYFDGKNKMTMKVNCDYYDSVYQRQITGWESKYERKSK